MLPYKFIVQVAAVFVGFDHRIKLRLSDEFVPPQTADVPQRRDAKIPCLVNNKKEWRLRHSVLPQRTSHRFGHVMENSVCHIQSLPNPCIDHDQPPVGNASASKVLRVKPLVVEIHVVPLGTILHCPHGEIAHVHAEQLSYVMLEYDVCVNVHEAFHG